MLPLSGEARCITDHEDESLIAMTIEGILPTSAFLRASLIPLLCLLFLGELVLLLKGCGGFVVRSDTIVEITFPLFAFRVRRHGKILSSISPSLFTIKGATEQSELTA